jgi:hypothetical protein
MVIMDRSAKIPVGIGDSLLDLGSDWSLICSLILV